VHKQPLPLTSLLDEVIVITAPAGDAPGVGYQTVAQRVGAEPETLLEATTHSEDAARTEHRRGELWAAHYVVAKWIREDRALAHAAEPRMALRLLGLDGDVETWRRVSTDEALRRLRDQLEKRLADL
jgi:hypothetical protein